MARQKEEKTPFEIVMGEAIKGLWGAARKRGEQKTLATVCFALQQLGWGRDVFGKVLEFWKQNLEQSARFAAFEAGETSDPKIALAHRAKVVEYKKEITQISALEVVADRVGAVPITVFEAERGIRFEKYDEAAERLADHFFEGEDIEVLLALEEIVQRSLVGADLISIDAWNSRVDALNTQLAAKQGVQEEIGEEEASDDDAEEEIEEEAAEEETVADEDDADLEADEEIEEEEASEDDADLEADEEIEEEEASEDDADLDEEAEEEETEEEEEAA